MSKDISMFSTTLRQSRRTILSSLAAALLTSTPTCLTLADAAQTRTAPVDRQVLAFYYGWYGRETTSGANHWYYGNAGRANQRWVTKDHPQNGAYASDDPSVISSQISTAGQAGLTGFIASWWGIGSYTDKNTALMLSAAAKSDFKISVIYEGTQGGSNSLPGTGVPSGPNANVPAIIEAMVNDLSFLLTQYGRHPNWLKVGSRPVIFLYGRAVYELTPAAWAEVRGRLRKPGLPEPFLIGDTWLNPDMKRAVRERPAFDAQFAYSTAGLYLNEDIAALTQTSAQTFSSWRTLANDRLFCATVVPGYDDSARPDRKPPRPLLTRLDGATYESQWKRALVLQPDFVLISTWNEWTEGTEIEASTEYDARSLSITRTASRQFLILPPRTVNISPL